MNIKSLLSILLCFSVIALELKLNVKTASSFVLLLISSVSLIVFNKKHELSEEVKDLVLNVNYPETLQTFESFVQCNHPHNPSIFHRCPRPYDSRYDENQDSCIYCGQLG